MPITNNINRHAYFEHEIAAVQAAADKQPREEAEWKKVRDAFKRELKRSKETPTAKVLAITIADDTINRSPKNPRYGTGWACVDTLAERIGASERSIRTSLKSLAKGGWIVIAWGHGKGNSNIYTINCDRAKLICFTATKTDADEQFDKRKNFPVRNTTNSEVGLPQEKAVSKSGSFQHQNRKELPPTPTRPLRYSDSDGAVAQQKLADLLGNNDKELGYAILNMMDATQIERCMLLFGIGSPHRLNVEEIFGIAKEAISSNSDNDSSAKLLCDLHSTALRQTAAQELIRLNRLTNFAAQKESDPAGATVSALNAEGRLSGQSRIDEISREIDGFQLANRAKLAGS